MKFSKIKDALESIVDISTNLTIEKNSGKADLHIDTQDGFNGADLHIDTKKGMFFNMSNSSNSTFNNEENNKDGSKKESSKFGNKENNRIFIVHGSNEVAKLEVKDILHEWGLKPLISGEEDANGQSILSNLLKHIKSCSYGIVLLTSDDIGYTKGNEDEKSARARQNVLIELGMLLIHFESKNIVILRQGDTEIPSDISGLIYKPFIKSVKEIKYELKIELERAGILEK